MLGDGESVGGVMIHVMTIGHLSRAAMAAAIMGDDAIALRQEEQHLGVPIVRGQRPAVMEDDRWASFGPQSL